MKKKNYCESDKNQKKNQENNENWSTMALINYGEKRLIKKKKKKKCQGK